MRAHVVFGKTLRDLASVRLLGAYLLPLTGLLALITWAASSEFAASAPPAQQELQLFAVFLGLSFFWVLGFPLQALTAVMSGNTLAREAQAGTLGILLTKPVRRLEVLFGTFAAVVVSATVVAALTLLIAGGLLVQFGDLEADLFMSGVLVTFPASLAFALLAATVVGAVGFAVAVYTRGRLRTVLPTLVLPLLYGAFMPVRLIVTESYEDYSLYLLDVGYHFGNAFVFLHETIGEDLPLEAQLQLAIWSGVYEIPDDEPPVGGSLETAGYISMEGSLLLLSGIALGALGIAAYRFQHMDV